MDDILGVLGSDGQALQQLIHHSGCVGCDLGRHVPGIVPADAGVVVVSDGHLVQGALDDVAGATQPLRLWLLIGSRSAQKWKLRSFERTHVVVRTHRGCPS